MCTHAAYQGTRLKIRTRVSTYTHARQEHRNDPHGIPDVQVIVPSVWFHFISFHFRVNVCVLVICLYVGKAAFHGFPIKCLGLSWVMLCKKLNGICTATSNCLCLHKRVILQSPSKSLCHRSSFWRRFVTYAIFDWRSFQENTLYPLAIIHVEHINVLDFDDKSERNLCFSFGNLWIIFNGASAQLFPPREKWLFGWVRGHPPANGGRD